MKKIFLFFLLLTGMQSFAQNFQFGLKAGVNISDFNGGDFGTIKTNSLVGFHGGAFVRFRFNKFAIQPELLFSSQGAKLEDATESENFKVNYVNLPILLQFHTGGGFFLEAGPQIGFKISEDIPDNTIGDFAKSTDLSLALGLGFQTRSGFGIGGRYNVGISKVGDFDSGAIDPDFRHGVIQVSLFFTLFNNR